MSTVQGEFRESSAEPQPRNLPLAHLSLELGHLYMEDFAAGPGRLRALFAEAAPWAEAAVRALPAPRPRVSTCFLVDDYFSDLVGPDEVMPEVLAAAAEAGLTIDYLARESSCALTASRVSPAELLVSRLVAEPEPGTNGGRPPATENGWLSNGRRSPDQARLEAMAVAEGWEPPAQNAARKHSIFVDVEMWDDEDGRTWSCPLLAAVWQLLRLGLLRSEGRPVLEPAEPPAGWPSRWQDVPDLVRLNPRAAPFAAYTTTSILSRRFLPVELAVGTVLGQVWHPPETTAQLAERARAEKFPLPADVLDRIGYAFTGSGRVDPF